MTPELTRRQRQAAATTEQLLAAAREVFARRGYAATTVGAITKAAPTAHGTFYLYFKNKEDIFARVVSDVSAELYREGRPPREGTAFEALEIGARRYLTVFQANRGLLRALLEAVHQSPAVEQLWLELRRPFIDRVERHLETLVGAGVVRPMDTAVAAQALSSMVEWFAFSHFVLDQPPGGARTLEQMAHTVTDLWFHALYGRVEGFSDCDSQWPPISIEGQADLRSIHADRT